MSVFCSVGLSFNQPKFCASATWNPDGETFANDSTVGAHPTTVFVTVTNFVYVAELNSQRVQMWVPGNNNPVRNISDGLSHPYGLFIANNGDVYVDNGNSNGRVDKWAWNTTSSVPVMNVSSFCVGLFIDINDTLYCSLGSDHKVIKTSLNHGGNLPSDVAGNGTAGLSSNMLNQPYGIFVDVQFNLYVADRGNNRIQLFHSGQMNATTIAGSGASATITLNYPTGIVLDVDGYLFITDKGNSRIVASGPNGFRCIVGCTNSSGSASNQLNAPWSLSFDSYGNLFVADSFNNRIQKFLLVTNLCGRYSTILVQKRSTERT